jgi:hypothetical protein
MERITKMIAKPPVPRGQPLAWSFIRRFTERVFAEDRIAVEDEQRAWDDQGAGLRPRGLFRGSGRPRHAAFQPHSHPMPPSMCLLLNQRCLPGLHAHLARAGQHHDSRSGGLDRYSPFLDEIAHFWVKE